MEWGFGHVYNLWESLRFLPLKKAGLTPVGKHFLVCVLLTNMRTCIRGGNQVSMYFECETPSFQEYISVPRPAHTRIDELVEHLEDLVHDLV